MILPPAFPLAWPDGAVRKRGSVSSPFRTQLPAAMKNLQTSMRLFAQDSGKAMGGVSITSNASLFDTSPTDTGVAVWFMWDDSMRAIAVDRFPKIADNIQAIHHVIEARRTELRYAGIDMVRTTFKGFMALPAPTDQRSWRDVLGLYGNPSASEVNAKYKTLAREHAGDEAHMKQINIARDMAIDEVK